MAHRFLACFALIATLGCAGTSESSRPAPLGLSGRQSSWATRVFGGPPDLVSAIRPLPGMDLGDHQVREMERSGLGFAIVHCRQADTYFYGDADRYVSQDFFDLTDGVVVLHGVPRGLDPTRSPDGGPGPVYFGQSGSGVRQYGAKPARGKPEVRIFVLPSSTWIISFGAVGGRLARVLASDSAEPPPLDAVPGSFIDTKRRVDASLRRQLANLGWQPELEDLERLEAGGQVVYPVFRGERLVFGLELVFSDEATAANAAAEAARDPRIHTKDFVGIDRFGSTVVIKAREATP